MWIILCQVVVARLPLLGQGAHTTGCCPIVRMWALVVRVIPCQVVVARLPLLGQGAHTTGCCPIVRMRTLVVRVILCQVVAARLPLLGQGARTTGCCLASANVMGAVTVIVRAVDGLATHPLARRTLASKAHS